MVGWAQTPNPRLRSSQLPGPWAPSLRVPASSHSSRRVLQLPPQFQGAPSSPPAVPGGSIPLPQFWRVPSPPTVPGGSLPPHPLPRFWGLYPPSTIPGGSISPSPMELCLRGAARHGPELPFRMRQVTKYGVWEKLTEPF